MTCAWNSRGCSASFSLAFAHSALKAFDRGDREELTESAEKGHPVVVDVRLTNSRAERPDNLRSIGGRMRHGSSLLRLAAAMRYARSVVAILMLTFIAAMAQDASPLPKYTIKPLVLPGAFRIPTHAQLISGQPPALPQVPDGR